MSDRYPGGIEDPVRLRELVELFEEREQRNFYYESALETVEGNFGGRWYRSDELVLGGPMLLLYTWNFAARETKSLDKNRIMDILERHHERIEAVRDAKLGSVPLEEGSCVHELVHAVWPEMQAYFGQTGTSKVLSLLAPGLFVMWDQDIRTRVRRRQGDPRGHERPDRGVYFFLKDAGYELEHNKPSFGRAADDYLVFLHYCQNILADISDAPIVTERDATPAKLLDEAFYSFYKIEHG